MNPDNTRVDLPEENPFADPSVQQAQSSQPASVGGLEEFRPFDSHPATPYSQPAATPATLPSVAETPKQQDIQNQPPPAYSASAQSQVSVEELQRRQQELEERARQLEQREEEQRQRLTTGNARQHNWPPLPSGFPVAPCFYQDIDSEIPVEFRRLVHLGYYLWLGHVGVMLTNIIGAMMYFIVAESNRTAAGSVFGVSLLMAASVTPCSFVCWFRPMYKAFRSDSSLNFMLFFAMLFANAILLAIQCLGLDYLGSCGWINALIIIRQSALVGAFMLVIAAGYTTLLVMDVMLLMRIHRIYRNTGASFVKARQEFSEGVLSSRTARNAAADAAVGAATASAARY